MRKQLLQSFAIVFALSILLPIKASASGGYCVIKGEKIYHSVFCSETWGYNIEDMKWYKTIKEVERTGYKPCESCADSMFDYEEDGSTRWFSKDAKIQNAMEMERFMGCMDSLEVLEESEESYNSGYEAGYDVGHDDGYAKAKDELEAKYKKNSILAKVVTIMLVLLFGVPFIGVIIDTLSGIVVSFCDAVNAFKKKK